MVLQQWARARASASASSVEGQGHWPSAQLGDSSVWSGDKDGQAQRASEPASKQQAPPKPQGRG